MGGISDWVSAPFDAVSSLVKGDIGGVADAALRGVSAGTFGVNKGSLYNVGGKQIVAKDNTSAQIQSDKIKNSKKRRALYGTSGGVLGQEVFDVGNNNRGNLFGN